MAPYDYEVCLPVHACLILFEIANKFVDMIVLTDYQDGNISDDPQDSVVKALFAFLGIGFLLSIQRVLLYLWRIHLYRIDDHSLDEDRIPTNLWMSFAKVWLEAFPQATIAMSCFSNCAVKENRKGLVQAFDVFSMLPFIIIILSVVALSSQVYR